jgi:hypothetical protein
MPKNCREQRIFPAKVAIQQQLLWVFLMEDNAERPRRWAIHRTANGFI